MKIIFYNHFHNGDLFTSKEFVRQLMNQLPEDEFGYAHVNHPKTIADLITYVGAPGGLSTRERFYKDHNFLYINTWIGVYEKNNYPEGPYFYDTGIDYPSLYKMWEYIYSVISDHLGVFVKLPLVLEDCLPSIDFTKYRIKPIEDFLLIRPGRKRILFSNGVPQSGQSFPFNMEGVINQLAYENPNYDFFVTAPIESPLTNVFHTSNIIRQDSDLNEIAYLSKFCDLIVGKNSGPFIFCLDKENTMDKDKKFITFNMHERDSLVYGVKHKCDFTWHDSSNIRDIYSLIDKKVKEL